MKKLSMKSWNKLKVGDKIGLFGIFNPSIWKIKEIDKYGIWCIRVKDRWWNDLVDSEKEGKILEEIIAEVVKVRFQYWELHEGKNYIKVKNKKQLETIKDLYG